ncbi:MAG: hypothetical protein ONB46_05820 [candidate division KSB1 bacterium]|nr:hypothetical protein [candidate division KSB1 bacterium]MDZ7365376.1 hypothetical protein [candidate division KSB1 bacterium]MDZ7403577.1 hypothetical protein [candidate division KSB1 bacterium]
MKNIALLVSAVLVFIQAATTATGAAAQTLAQLANRNLKIIGEQQGGRVIFKMQTPAGSDVLVAGPPSEKNAAWKNTLRPELLSRLSGVEEPLVFTSVEQIARSRTLRFSGSSKNVSLVREATLTADYPAAYIVDKWRVGPAAKIQALLSSFNFAPQGKSYSEIQPLDFTWTPHLRPQPGDLIADHVFRSPAVMLQKDSIFVALIPDLSYLIKNRALPLAMDLQLPQLLPRDSLASLENDSTRRAFSNFNGAGYSAPILSFGFWPWKTREHVYYQPDPTPAPRPQDTEVSYAYYLWLEHRAASFPRALDAKTKTAGAPFRRVVDFLWEKFSPAYRDGNVGPLPATLDALAQRAWKQYADQTWFETKLNGRPIGGMKSERLAWTNSLPEEANNDVWFNSRLQTLRTAYGMYLYGKRSRDPVLMQRAEKVLNLALSAPNEGGLFPSIYYFTKTTPEPSTLSAAVVKIAKQKEPEPITHHWAGDEGRIGFGSDYNHTFDASWTGYWLLQWADLLPQRRQEILAFCRPYADFLLHWQQPSGVIPSWFHRHDHRPREEFFQENAETAGSALFLAGLFNRTKEQRYLDAAVNAMNYLTREILPRNKWFDDETFLSCSRQPFDFYDSLTGQFPQSTLSMNQAAMAYLALYKITAKPEYLQWGAHVLDYALLYQQVWSPPFFSRNLFGGFGAQNTDGEWSDARQAYFAETLLDYFEATGKRAYFERAIAAMRAGFALFHRDSPKSYENWAHDDGDSPGNITSIHWGTGSAAAAFERMRERLGDAYVFMGEKPSAGGINAVWIENLHFKADTIQFNLLSSLPWSRRVTVKFFNVPPGRYRVKINDDPFVPFTHNLLARGIYIPQRRVVTATHRPPKYFYARSAQPLQIALNASGVRGNFSALLNVRPQPASKASFHTIPFRAGVASWAASLPESYKKDGARFQYYITYKRGSTTLRLPTATESDEFYHGEVQPFMFADCGDDGETYLGAEKDSRISGFAGSRYRAADGAQWFSYVFPIQATTARVKISFAAAGECRVTAGDSLLLDEGDAGRGDMTEHRFELTDPGLWTNGKLILRFSDAHPQHGEGVNVAWIKVEE